MSPLGFPRCRLRVKRARVTAASPQKRTLQAPTNPDRRPHGRSDDCPENGHKWDSSVSHNKVVPRHRLRSFTALLELDVQCRSSVAIRRMLKAYVFFNRGNTLQDMIDFFGVALVLTDRRLQSGDIRSD